MPRSPLKPCPRQRCNQLIHRKEPACLAHQQQAMREWDAGRGTAASRGYDARHRRWREAILARDPYCKLAVRCDGSSRATIADHITPLRLGGDFAMENGQGVCQSCHDHKRATTDRGRASTRIKRTSRGGENLPLEPDKTAGVPSYARRHNRENRQNRDLPPRGQVVHG